MKVKLKGKAISISLKDCSNNKYLGVDLKTWKKLNQGNKVELLRIPKEAEDSLVSTEKKVKKETKKINKGEEDGN